METTTDTTPGDEISRQPVADRAISKTLQQKSQRTLLHLSRSEWLILLGLALVALIPRIMLAAQLETVTDELVYITGGKVDFPLLAHFHISADQWGYNYEHPPVVKLLIGFVLYLNSHTGFLFNELFAARIPSILFGTLLVVSIYWLGRAPFGRVIALLAALCLAFSPWLVYFSALAYLDMTMTALITIAYLLLWPALRNPRLYLLIAALLGLAAASKYTAVLSIPGIVLFTAFYFFALRPRLPAEQRPAIPWLWWLAALLLSPIVFLIADPAIWPSPLSLLKHSFLFEWDHSQNGHLTFIAGQYGLHVPHWSILYIVITKLSAFVTISAAFFVLFALIQLVRFYLPRSNVQVQEAASMTFILIWLLSITGMFSLLNIVVGTHYDLPIAPPVVLAGALGLTTLLRYHRGTLFQSTATDTAASVATQTPGTPKPDNARINPRAALILAILTVLLLGPHLFGLSTTYAAEGYSSEFFHGENASLQVAYSGFREAGFWLLAHTHGNARVGIIGASNSQIAGAITLSWYSYNQDLIKGEQGRLKFIQGYPNDRSFPYDYIIWPMHLVQRGYAIPEPWHSYIVHTIMGGSTVYCFIMARDPATIF